MTIINNDTDLFTFIRSTPDDIMTAAQEQAIWPNGLFTFLIISTDPGSPDFNKII